MLFATIVAAAPVDLGPFQIEEEGTQACVPATSFCVRLHTGVTVTSTWLPHAAMAVRGRVLLSTQDVRGHTVVHLATRDGRTEVGRRVEGDGGVWWLSGATDEVSSNTRHLSELLLNATFRRPQTTTSTLVPTPESTNSRASVVQVGPFRLTIAGSPSPCPQTTEGCVILTDDLRVEASVPFSSFAENGPVVDTERRGDDVLFQFAEVDGRSHLALVHYEGLEEWWLSGWTTDPAQLTRLRTVLRDAAFITTDPATSAPPSSSIIEPPEPTVTDIDGSANEPQSSAFNEIELGSLVPFGRLATHESPTAALGLVMNTPLSQGREFIHVRLLFSIPIGRKRIGDVDARSTRMHAGLGVSWRSGGADGQGLAISADLYSSMRTSTIRWDRGDEHSSVGFGLGAAGGVGLILSPGLSLWGEAHALQAIAFSDDGPTLGGLAFNLTLRVSP